MLLPNAKPGSSAENKTGDWRSSRPVVNIEKCIKCGICQMYCPEPCITGLENPTVKLREFPKIDYDYCKGCGICAYVCPVKCILMSVEQK